MKKIILIVFILVLIGTLGKNDPPEDSHEETLIPRSVNESAKYYLISQAAEGDYLKTTHSRISSSSKGYSLTIIDCKNRKFQDAGYGEGSVSNIELYKEVSWTDPVKGSSKSDLLEFVCR